MPSDPEPIQQVIERQHKLWRLYQDAASVEAQNPTSQAARDASTRAYLRYVNYASDAAPRLAQALTETLAREDAYVAAHDAFYDHEGPEFGPEARRLWEEYETAMSAIVGAVRDRAHDARKEPTP